MLTIPLFVFAKAPIAGQVKTRLLRDCSQQQAAEIAKILLNTTLQSVTRFWPGEVILSSWQQHPYIKQLAEQFKLSLHQQVEGDLGQKMQQAFESLKSPAAIIGADVPLLDKDLLLSAYQQLQANNNAIISSQDGGYCLIALSQSAPELFSGINWGQSSVFAETLQAAKKAKIKLQHIGEASDIDYWQDVLAASQHILELKEYLQNQKLIN